ncbi:hypothetical protein H3H37_24640 [Duganella sp. LX20W]|uniref:Uncharacterized protein n=1 Tax=Rugamonas brunnea TaxID=2758569 RepID=A0A7W2IED4_9BURK|nr:hypothetical protein [Rugamonas brunnea]MBA5640258.1 hypothetical protein [Rugamonas brunnea]
MAIVKAYTPRLRDIKPMGKGGGYDASNKTFTPFAEISDELSAVEEILDAIAAAAEAGFLDSEKWVTQVFTTTDVLQKFLADYAQSYTDIYRTHDRWWQALGKMIEWPDEDSFVEARDIADKLWEQAQDTGQV